jgi:hypothetical protein
MHLKHIMALTLIAITGLSVSSMAGINRSYPDRSVEELKLMTELEIAEDARLACMHSSEYMYKQHFNYNEVQHAQRYMTGTRAVNMSQLIAADVLPPSLEITLSRNQTAFRTGDTLRVGFGARNPDPAFLADFYFGVLLPDGVTVLFVTSLAPLNGVLTRFDGDPRTFRPLLANVQLPQGLDTTLTDFFVYPFAGGEPPGTYTVFAALTPPGAFNDGRVDPGDLLVIDVRPFSFSP